MAGGAGSPAGATSRSITIDGGDGSPGTPRVSLNPSLSSSPSNGSFFSASKTELRATWSGRAMTVKAGMTPPVGGGALAASPGLLPGGLLASPRAPSPAPQDVRKTTHEMPDSLLNDGFVIESFDYAELADVSVRPVGEGDQAAVHSCVVPFGKYAGQTMALKVLRPELAAKEDEVQAFVREANFLARISHPHVLGMLGCGTTDERRPCLVIDWVESDVARELKLDLVDFDAGARWAVRRDWPSAARVALLRDLAATLAFLHGGEAIPGTVVLHRDLKPANLGLTADRRLKLLDFGLAVALERTAAKTAETYELTGGAGTRRYMAPEVWRSEPYGTAADVYGFALVAYEICSLYGKPYAAYDPKTMYRKVIEHGKRPKLPLDWHSWLLDLLPRAWAPDQKDRCGADHAAKVLAQVLGACDDPLGQDPAAAPS
ncbi:protein kinase [Aureococcus anophagefferens]|nr:protein kinase [Aureococcus anophagefferens]